MPLEMRIPAKCLQLTKPGAFKFNDGTTRGWTIDQFYDTNDPNMIKISAYTDPNSKKFYGFSLSNSQNLALAAGVYPMIVLTTADRSHNSTLARLLPRVLLGLLVLFSTYASAQTFILTFHHLESTSGFTLVVQPEDLEAQLEQLLEQDYHFKTITNGTSFTGKVALIVFDDGNKDVFEIAYPMLAYYKITATVFVATERIGTEGFMTWDDLRVLESEGWTIGSHGHLHTSLRDLTPASIRADLKIADAVLATQLSQPSSCLAYPFGRHDERVRSIASETYTCGLSTGFTFEDTDIMSLGRSLATPFDPWSLNWRLENGFDLRTPIILTELGYWLLPSSASPVAHPAFYQPTRYLFMGSGQVGLEWHDATLYQDFFYREDSVALSSVTARIGGSYSEFSLITYIAPLSLGAGISSNGAFIAASLNLVGYGEIWGSFDTSGNYAIGTELLPFDYLRLSASYSPSSNIALQLKYGLPIFPEEGRPLRILLGYDEEPYLGANLNIGGLELESKLSLEGSVAVGFRLSW